jgi:hypothetical protein
MANLAYEVRDQAYESADCAAPDVQAQSRNPHESTKRSATRIARKGLAVIGAAGFALIAVGSIIIYRNLGRPDEYQAHTMGLANSQPETASDQFTPATNRAALASPALAAKSAAVMQNGLLDATRPAAPNPQAPMIARTASLTILVKNFAVARGSLDPILARFGGYSASLIVNTPENGQRHFQASLRIPAGQLDSALNDLKNLGRTLNESQSGEEVTQQHADLVARLQNSRETEQRLRAILEQRTGKIQDVLQVEEEIARVRGEIESMESEQKTLEHRVTYAAVELQLVEEYKESFDSSPVSTSGRLRNALVNGMRNAFGTVIGLILFVEEFGPVILIWLAILALPTWFALRRFQRMNAHP